MMTVELRVQSIRGLRRLLKKKGRCLHSNLPVDLTGSRTSGHYRQLLETRIQNTKFIYPDFQDPRARMFVSGSFVRLATEMSVMKGQDHRGNAPFLWAMEQAS